MSKIKTYVLIVSILMASSFVACRADSLWTNNSRSAFATPIKHFKVGDAITVYINETTQAAQEGKTETSKESEVKGSLVDAWSQVATAIAGNERLAHDRDFNLGGGDNYSGKGKTSRKSSVKAVITVIVNEIQEDGNLLIIGKHKVKVNDELETIQIAGVLRAADVSRENTVYSYQIANAEISVKGAGTVSQKQTPGVFTRVFGWLF